MSETVADFVLSRLRDWFYSERMGLQCAVATLMFD